MFEQQSNSQISWTKTFRGSEDDVIDSFLSVLRRDRWENLKLHYESGSLSAERLELRVHAEDGEKEEMPVTFAIAASWFESDGQTELMIEISELEFEWTQDECGTIAESILEALKYTYAEVAETSNVEAQE